jgi:transposase
VDLDAAQHLAALRHTTPQQHRARHAELFGELPSSRNRAWLLKRLAWRVQALAEGDLSERARQRAAELIHRHFGVTLPHDHVGRFLRQRLHWSPQKPRRRARERNEEAVARWKRDTFLDILTAAAARDAHVVLPDESGFMLTPTVRRTWAPSGETPLLSCWDRRDRLSAISCITVSPQRARLDFYFTLLRDNTNATAEHVLALPLTSVSQAIEGFVDGQQIEALLGEVVQHLVQRHPPPSRRSSS